MCKLVKCDICSYRDHQKGSTPCSVCSSNKNYISHFKEDPIVTKLKEFWGITDDRITVDNHAEIEEES